MTRHVAMGGALFNPVSVEDLEWTTFVNIICDSHLIRLKKGIAKLKTGGVGDFLNHIQTLSFWRVSADS